MWTVEHDRPSFGQDISCIVSIIHAGCGQSRGSHGCYIAMTSLAAVQPKASPSSPGRSSLDCFELESIIQQGFKNMSDPAQTFPGLSNIFQLQNAANVALGSLGPSAYKDSANSR